EKKLRVTVSGFSFRSPWSEINSMSKTPYPRVDRSFFPPDRSALGRAAVQSIARAVITVGRTHQFNKPSETAKALFPNDADARRIVERGASSPAMTDGSSWGDTLSPTVVSTFLGSLGPLSAA